MRSNVKAGTRPACPPNGIDPCNHKWVYLSTHYSKEPGSYNSTYIRIDVFYCEKCCKQKEVRKEECSRIIPTWWIH